LNAIKYSVIFSSSAAADPTGRLSLYYERHGSFSTLEIIRVTFPAARTSTGGRGMPLTNDDDQVKLVTARHSLHIDGHFGPSTSGVPLSSLAGRLLAGAIAGGVATAVMSAQMIAAPSTRRIGTPPPRRIADALLPGRSDTELERAATLIHLAIGAASGALYRGFVRRPGVVSGVAFGVAIWAVGYQAVVPALGVLPVATRDDHQRQTALIEAHIVYGAALGIFS
jgi:hypothetical protein